MVSVFLKSLIILLTARSQLETYSVIQHSARVWYVNQGEMSGTVPNLALLSRVVRFFDKNLLTTREK